MQIQLRQHVWIVQQIEYNVIIQMENVQNVNLVMVWTQQRILVLNAKQEQFPMEQKHVRIVEQ